MPNYSGVWTLQEQYEARVADVWDRGPLSQPLFMWGDAGNGELGLGDVVDLSSPVQLGALKNWTHVSTGDFHTTAVNREGELYAWGNNNNGNLGNGDVTATSSPIQVGALSNWSTTSSEGRSNIALKTNGTMWAWGQGTSGQLGNGASLDSSSPVQIGALTNWTRVASCNGGHTLAVNEAGELYSWGTNPNGQLGHNNQTTLNSPVQVGSLTTWAEVAGGENTSFAIKTDGTLWAWGNGSFGRTGLNINLDRSSPVQIGALTNWTSVSAMDQCGVAVKTDGTMWAWGLNNTGQAGDDTTINRSSPVQVGSDTDWGTSFSCGDGIVVAIKTGGGLYAWGDNGNGQLGLNDQIKRSSPVQIGSDTNWIVVAANGHAAAITSFE
jgi:alpha-tubulin suppressor-like RCC1 family protein